MEQEHQIWENWEHQIWENSPKWEHQIWKAKNVYSLSMRNGFKMLLYTLLLFLCI